MFLQQLEIVTTHCRLLAPWKCCINRIQGKSVHARAFAIERQQSPVSYVGTLPKGYTRGAPLSKVPSYRAQKQPLRKKQVHLPRTPISRIGARLAAAQCALPRGSYPAQ